jgi:NAD(P)-dependent dehydrogenase (short-subunit alcohol dehydrogenase family)
MATRTAAGAGYDAVNVKGGMLAWTRAGEGALVVAGARSVASLDAMENVTPFAADLIDPGGPARLVGEAIRRHGRIDVLVARHARGGGGDDGSRRRRDRQRRVGQCVAVLASPRTANVNGSNFVIDGGLIKTM